MCNFRTTKKKSNSLLKGCLLFERSKLLFSATIFFIICNKRGSDKLYYLLMWSQNFTRSKLLKNQFLEKYKRTPLKYHLSCLIKDRSDLVFLPLTWKRKSAFFKVALNLSILHPVLEQGLRYCCNVIWTTRWTRSKIE